MDAERELQVVRVDLEGGFWGLVSEDGGKYQPLDLPETYQVDGLRIVARLESVTAFTTAQWGKTVRVTSIRASDID